MKSSILIIDDDVSITTMLRENFSEEYEVFIANGGKEGIEEFNKNLPGAIVLDLNMPDMNGMEVLEKIKEIDTSTPVIMLTAYGDIETAVQAIKIGAYQFLTKPVDLGALGSIISKAVEQSQAQKGYQFFQEKLDHSKYELIWDDNIVRAIDLVAKNSDTTVLVAGPTGTGKGTIAKLIHDKSARRGALFVDINCAGLSETFLESELFGHERGAFTDAKSMKKGMMEIADKGTLFLDEVGEMPLSVQAKILKAIETHTFRRMGGTTTIKVNVRIIAATNVDLNEKIERGGFREDLYYRLNVIPINLPSLKEVKKNIPKLAMSFIREFANKMNKPVKGFTDEALSIIWNYSWPGNIRELRNVIERATILCEGDNIISPQHLPYEIQKRDVEEAYDSGGKVSTLEELEKRHIIHTLNLTRNKKSAAAKLLGINASTLWRKINKYGISDK